MHDRSALEAARRAARAHERGLDPHRRKRLGQFFTGVPLGRLLAHLALGPGTRTVLDPMAGHGDLLDAAWEAATERGLALERIDGIEVDPDTAAVCRRRLAVVVGEGGGPGPEILAADAFDPATLGALPSRSYDLVITNPPYVRHHGRNGASGATDSVRSGLREVVDGLPEGQGGAVWRALADGYSGRADLSVPAWLLAGFMVRPGGRLALVAPATWRSRDYADVVRYLLLRCFALETVVADAQPGWFPDALVRTHLVVARRLAADEAREPLGARRRWPAARWLQVSPDAADGRSLVGAAFTGGSPEAEFAEWLHGTAAAAAPGVEAGGFGLDREWASLRARSGGRRWFRYLEGGGPGPRRVSVRGRPAPPVLPDMLRETLPTAARPDALATLDDVGIRVGQGLRTGCNGFFYVTVCGEGEDGMVPVKPSQALGGGMFRVPAAALRPVLRRQSEIAQVREGGLPPGRALDLRAWVLPEDERQVAAAMAAYALGGEAPPRVMPPGLGAYVRHAAASSPDGPCGRRLIPELSAVRTNARTARGDRIPPRFWYMLPEFAPRHLPAAFVPRINQGTPWVERNSDPPLLIDANFVSFWTPKGDWSPAGIKALLNSVWCRACMEASGTPLGGGALKLEATHLRQMPVPRLSRSARKALHEAGMGLERDSGDVQARVDRILLRAIFPGGGAPETLLRLADGLASRTSRLCVARQRVAA